MVRIHFNLLDFQLLSKWCLKPRGEGIEREREVTCQCWSTAARLCRVQCLAVWFATHTTTRTYNFRFIFVLGESFWNFSVTTKSSSHAMLSFTPQRHISYPWLLFTFLNSISSIDHRSNSRWWSLCNLQRLQNATERLERMPLHHLQDRK